MDSANYSDLLDSLKQIGTLLGAPVFTQASDAIHALIDDMKAKTSAFEDLQSEFNKQSEEIKTIQAMNEELKNKINDAESEIDNLYKQLEIANKRNHDEGKQRRNCEKKVPHLEFDLDFVPNKKWLE